jgi:hypothetical protein
VLDYPSLSRVDQIIEIILRLAIVCLLMSLSSNPRKLEPGPLPLIMLREQFLGTFIGQELIPARHTVPDHSSRTGSVDLHVMLSLDLLRSPLVEMVNQLQDVSYLFREGQKLTTSLHSFPPRQHDASSYLRNQLFLLRLNPRRS